MKLPALPLAASITVNLAFAILLAVGVATSPRTSPPKSPPPPATATPADAVDPHLWKNLAEAEPANFAARLRAAGFPRSLIRAIVDAQVREHFSARHRALAEAESARPFWRGGAMGLYASDPKINAARRALRHDEDDLRRELLGPDASEVADSTVETLRQRFGDFPREKLVQLQRINSDYNELQNESREEAGEIVLPEDRARLALLQKERDADIARLLTPEEKLEYEFHHSTTANRLRTQLAAFDPTEEEYRKLFTLQRAVDVAYGAPGTLSPAERRERNQAQKQLIGQIETALGPARFAEYQQATDPAYQSVSQLVSRLELPPATTTQVLAVQKDITQRVATLQADRTLPGPQRLTQLAALSEEATKKLTAALGEQGVKAYTSSSGGWLQNLQTRAARAPSAPPQP